MLVLSRKEGEVVWVGPSIRITVIKSTGTTVRFGIEAPADCKVLREELVPVEWLEGAGRGADEAKRGPTCAVFSRNPVQSLAVTQ